MPATFRYALAVSRRTPVASSMRRSGQPRRPRARTCSRFSLLKTLAIPARELAPVAVVNVPTRSASLAGFQASFNGRFWVSPEVWKWKLGSPKLPSRTKSPRSLDFVEVLPEAVHDAPVEIVVERYRLRLDRRVDAAALARVLEVVRGRA